MQRRQALEAKRVLGGRALLAAGYACMTSDNLAKRLSGRWSG